MKVSWKLVGNIIISLAIILILAVLFLYACDATGCSIGDYTLNQLNAAILAIIPKLALLLALYFVFTAVSKFGIDYLFKKVFCLSHPESEFYTTAKLWKFFLWFSFIILAIGIVFRNVGALLTSLGLIGFGITFALQKPIMNFVGWITIISSRTYTVGDRIKVGEIRGDVVDIKVMNTLMMSLLETSDLRSDKIVSVPNELVLTSAVENYTKSSNFVTEETIITITYESKYHDAMDLLKKIADEVGTKNIDLYKKRVRTRRIEIEKRINRLTRKFLHGNDGEDGLKGEMKELEQERKDLDGLVTEIKEQFKAKVRVELHDSSIALVCQFYCPYNRIKLTKTKINLRFLDAIAKRDDIEIAYPHIELVHHKEDKVRKK